MSLLNLNRKRCGLCPLTMRSDAVVMETHLKRKHGCQRICGLCFWGTADGGQDLEDHYLDVHGGQLKFLLRRRSDADGEEKFMKGASALPKVCEQGEKTKEKAETGTNAKTCIRKPKWLVEK